MSRTQLRVTRRIFLTALGLGLSAPAALRLSRVALAQPTPAPKRLVVFYMPHGVPNEHFNPTVHEDGTFSLTPTAHAILAPLETALRPYTTVVQGIAYPEAATHEGSVSLLSDLPPGMDVTDTETPRTTFEHLIARELGVSPLVLGACAHGIWGQEPKSRMFWDGQAIIPEKSPVAAFDQVFGELAASAEPDPDVALTASLHGLTARQLAALKTELGHLTHEQTELANHLEAVEALAATGGASTSSCTSRPTIPAVEGLRAAAAGQGDDFFLRDENFPTVLAAQLAVAAQAVRCNARSIVAVQPLFSTSDLSFQFMDLPSGHHNGISHAPPPSNLTDPASFEQRKDFAAAQRWFAQQLVTHLLEPLLEPDPASPGQTVLDNTIVYWFSEVGDGQNHNKVTRPIINAVPPGTPPFAYIPAVLIGKGGGALGGGRVVTLPTDRSHQDLYLTLCQAMGTGIMRFGESTTALGGLA